MAIRNAASKAREDALDTECTPEAADELLKLSLKLFHTANRLVMCVAHEVDEILESAADDLKDVVELKKTTGGEKQ